MNNHIKCLIVDDEPVAQRILEGYLVDLAEFELVGKCLSAIAARDFLKKQEVDLMFLDLEMPKLKGFSFLKTLRNPPKVIITTAYREYALEGYELEVLDYLLKPITFERFLKAINRFQRFHQPAAASANQDSKEQAFIYVKSDRKTIRLRLNEIRYIEGMNNYIKIHYGEKVHIVYASLSKILEELNDDFLRVHKSFIINKNHITAFSQELIELEERQIPVGNTFRSKLKDL